jgi:hypothetical protein
MPRTKGGRGRSAAKAAGYSASTVQKGNLLSPPGVREALEHSLEAQGLSIPYLVSRIKDLCEASDERDDGTSRPNWIARVKGAELLMRLLRVDWPASAGAQDLEEIAGRMLEDARAFDARIEIVDVGDSGKGNRTEIVMMNEDRR